MLRSGALEGRPESETTQLTMARVLIVKGDATSIERVLIRLERLLQVAVEEGRTGVKVDCLSRQGNRFVVTAGDLRYEAENVVVAMANYQSPRLPPFAQELDPGIIQLHSSEYLNPSQLQNGGVLIVGAGNSGSEIALEVAHGHPTWISGRDTGQMPFRIEGFAARYLLIHLVLRFLFHNVLTVNTPIGRKVRPKVLSQGGPLIRVQSKDLATAGIVRVPRTVSVRDGRPVLEDGRVLHVANVVWCTGFEPGFSWIDLPVFGEKEPLHERGVVANEPGLYFVGLHFLSALSSAMIHGVERDAAHVAQVITSRGRRDVLAVGQLVSSDQIAIMCPAHPRNR
jgi:putative flavoprotein involved in K+ transport